MAGDVCVDALLELVELVWVFGQDGGVEAVFVGYALSLCFDAAFCESFLVLALGELFCGFTCGFGFCRFGFLVGEFACEYTVEFLLRVGAFDYGWLLFGLGVGVASATAFDWRVNGADSIVV